MATVRNFEVVFDKLKVNEIVLNNFSEKNNTNRLKQV
jgi:hypothetical protein